MAGTVFKLLFFSSLSLMIAGMRLPNAAPIFIVSAVAQDRSSVQLKDDPFLKETITVEATNLPLVDVLAGLSRQLKVDVTAEAPVGIQRATLHLEKQPLHHVMGRLAGLLGHSPLAPRGYLWEKLERKAGSRPGYRLWRDSRSKREE